VMWRGVRKLSDPGYLGAKRCPYIKPPDYWSLPQSHRIPSDGNLGESSCEKLRRINVFIPIFWKLNVLLFWKLSEPNDTPLNVARSETIWKSLLSENSEEEASSTSKAQKNYPVRFSRSIRGNFFYSKE
jgi:hypothetical protein